MRESSDSELTIKQKPQAPEKLTKEKIWFQSKLPHLKPKRITKEERQTQIVNAILNEALSDPRI